MSPGGGKIALLSFHRVILTPSGQKWELQQVLTIEINSCISMEDKTVN